MTYLRPIPIPLDASPGSVLPTPDRDRLRPALSKLVGVKACRKLLDSAGESGVLRWPAAELASACGIPQVQAERVVAARELSAPPDSDAHKRVVSSADVLAHLPRGFATWETEAVLAVVLSRAMHVQSLVLIARGGASGVALETRDVFAPLVRLRASGFVLVHNHPGGSSTPSDADVALTNRVASAGRILDIPLIDHVIVSSGGVFSLADADLMPTDSELDGAGIVAADDVTF